LPSTAASLEKVTKKVNTTSFKSTKLGMVLCVATGILIGTQIR